MKLIILSVLFLIVSCGKQVTTRYIEVDRRNAFEGYYALPEGGFADVIEDAQNLVSTRVLRLIVRNSDDSTGIIPIGSIPSIALVDNTVYYKVNLSYTSAQNIKRDLTNSPVVGTFLTEIQVKKKDEKIFFTMIVSDVNSVLYKKTIESI